MALHMVQLNCAFKRVLSTVPSARNATELCTLESLSLTLALDTRVGQSCSPVQ